MNNLTEDLRHQHYDQVSRDAPSSRASKKERFTRTIQHRCLGTSKTHYPDLLSSLHPLTSISHLIPSLFPSLPSSLTLFTSSPHSITSSLHLSDLLSPLTFTFPFISYLTSYIHLPLPHLLLSLPITVLQILQFTSHSPFPYPLPPSFSTSSSPEHPFPFFSET